MTRPGTILSQTPRKTAASKVLWLSATDAASAITRLVDMGIPPFLVSSAVQGVVAQRLVRRLCGECSEEYTPERAEIEFLGLDPGALVGRTFRRAKGCRACGGNGYHGRLGLFELLELDSDLRDAVFRGEPLETIKNMAHATGRLQNLLVAGAQKVLAGLTTVQEIMRVTRNAQR